MIPALHGIELERTHSLQDASISNKLVVVEEGASQRLFMTMRRGVCRDNCKGLIMNIAVGAH